jgi:6,7-dimethyl-8-ribityllumazine synthase
VSDDRLIEGAEDLRLTGSPPSDAPFGVNPPAAPVPVPVEPDPEPVPGEPEPEPDLPPAAGAEPKPGVPLQHAPGDLVIPPGVGVFTGAADGNRRSVGIVVSRFNGELTSKLLTGALEFLEKAGVDRARVDVMQVPGAFELPLGAMALARTRRYACVLALGVVIRGDTPHFDYIASEAASGVQLAALETGIPVALGVLTCDTREQAEARSGGAKGNKGAEAARTGLEMADVLGRLRSDAVVTS